MARDTTVYSLAHVATMIEENRELIEAVAANPDNIDYGEMIHITDGTEERVTAFTARGIESLQEFLDERKSLSHTAHTGGIRWKWVSPQKSWKYASLPRPHIPPRPTDP